MHSQSINIDMNFVFISHPYHYHITLVSIKRMIELYGSKIKNITVIFDDCDEYWTECRFVSSFKNDLLSNNIDANVIPSSAIKETKFFSNGWVRQQIVKLNLHKVLDYDEWICIDGDTIFQEKIKLNKLYVNINDAVCTWPHHYNFINYVLDLDYQNIQHEGLILHSVSGIPFRNMKKEMLKDLHSYIEELHGCNLIEILNSFTLKKNVNRYFEISEWDLMGHFEVLVSKSNLPIHDLFFVVTDTKDFEETVCNNKIKVLGGTDDFSQRWYNQHGITINQDVFKILKYNHYYVTD